jgi:hypothetical protein
MTQIRKVLFNRTFQTYAAMKSEEYVPSEDKNNSKDCQMAISGKAEKIIMELNSMHGQAKEKIIELIHILKNEDKLKDHEVKRILFERVDFVSKRTLYRVLPQDFKKTTKPIKPLPKTINVSTEHNVIDIDVPSRVTPTIRPLPSNKALEPPEEITMRPSLEDENEEPTELELAEIRIAQLEDALRKTEMFKPATAFTEQDKQSILVEPPEEYFFEWLRKRENKINVFYYDNYGIELIPNRLIPQLKNAGVKTFKRLYFEV